MVTSYNKKKDIHIKNCVTVSMNSRKIKKENMRPIQHSKKKLYQIYIQSLLKEHQG